MKYVKELAKVLIVIPYVLIISSTDLVGVPFDIEIVTVGDTKTLVLAVQNMSFIFLFGILFGHFMYKTFTVGSVYYFSRIYSRGYWYWGKVVQLGIISFLYSVTYVMVNLWICMRKSTQTINHTDYCVVLIIIVYIAILIQLIAVVINLLSIKLGNIIGFLMVCIGIVILIGVALSGTTNSVIRLLNPFMMGDMMSLKARWMYSKIIANSIWVLGGCIYGMQLIKKKDILHTDME